MTAKSLFISIIFLFTICLSAAQVPRGTFSCPIEITENGGISIAPGQDFPDFHHWDAPRTRKEVLILSFQGNSAEVINPEVLPNWLLVTSPYYADQTSWFQDYLGERLYSIEWNNTWYFGSTVHVSIKELSDNSLVSEIRFDDNDGWSATLENVVCTSKL